MNISRKQFLGSLLAGATAGCMPAIESPFFLKNETTELEKCRNDILYFVDNYLEVNDRLYGKLKMSPQQREYLKRISTAPDYFFCAKGRQVGISTANNVFVYWKNLFFPGHKVWIVEPNMAMAKRIGESFANISNTGGFDLDSNRIHFVSPHALNCVDWHDRNNTFILDEFAWWSHRPESFELSLDLYNTICDGSSGSTLKNIIAVSTPTDHVDLFSMLMEKVDSSRKLVLPSPTRGLEA